MCDKQQKQLFLMKFFKLVVKNSFYVHYLKENEKLIGFISSIMKGVDILDIPLKKVLVSGFHFLLHGPSLISY